MNKRGIMNKKNNRIWTLALVGLLGISCSLPVRAAEQRNEQAIQQEAIRSGDEEGISAAFLYAELSEDGTKQNVVIKLDFEGNVEVSKKVADVAAALGIPCEAELGKVGGKEDDLEAEADTNTDPKEARKFAERTGVTSLAVAIGTAHGFYVGTPVLDKERLSEIRQVVDIPLVLHGASGLTDEDVKDCVKRGICKVNFATELRAAYSEAVKATFAEKQDTIDPKAYGKAGIAAVKELVMARMKVCGCDGKV